MGRHLVLFFQGMGRWANELLPHLGGHLRMRFYINYPKNTHCLGGICSGEYKMYKQESSTWDLEKSPQRKWLWDLWDWTSNLIDPSWNCGSALEEVCSLCLGLCGLVDVVFATLLAVGNVPLSSGMAHSSAGNLKSSSLGNPLLQPESVSSWPDLWSQVEGWLCSALPSLTHQWAVTVRRWVWGALVEGMALTAPVSYSVLLLVIHQKREWGVSHCLHFLQNHTQRASIPCSRSQSL